MPTKRITLKLKRFTIDSKLGIKDLIIDKKNRQVARIVMYKGESSIADGAGIMPDTRDNREYLLSDNSTFCTMYNLDEMPEDLFIMKSEDEDFMIKGLITNHQAEIEIQDIDDNEKPSRQIKEIQTTTDPLDAEVITDTLNQNPHYVEANHHLAKIREMPTTELVDTHLRIAQIHAQLAQVHEQAKRNALAELTARHRKLL